VNIFELLLAAIFISSLAMVVCSTRVVSIESQLPYVAERCDASPDARVLRENLLRARARWKLICICVGFLNIGALVSTMFYLLTHTS